jgi:hypothetical protein
MCKATVIARKGNISVTQCVNCKVVNIWNHSVLISFSFEQFHAFINATQGLNFDDFLEISPDGIEIVVLATPSPDFNLVFNRQDWHDFFAVLCEAAYMQEIYKMVHH